MRKNFRSLEWPNHRLYRLCNRDWKPAYPQYWHSLLRIPTYQRVRKEERRGFSSPDLRQNITQDGRSSRQHDKGIGVRAGGVCARNDCRCASAGETLTANRLNGHFHAIPSSIEPYINKPS